MSVKSRLDKLWENGGCVILPPSTKLVFMSDFHANDGGPADDLLKNEGVLLWALRDCLKDGYHLILLGDVEDFWECPDPARIYSAHTELLNLLSRFDTLGRLIRIKGNHDWDTGYSEYQIIQIGDIKILCIHGHQGDWANDQWRGLGQFIVRYIWTPLQWIGLRDLTVAKRKRHERQETEIMKWADENMVVVACGHTHRLTNSTFYKNSGSWVGNGGSLVRLVNGDWMARYFDKEGL